MLVREQRGRDQPGQLQRIHGEQHHLQQRAIAAGAVQLSDAIAHWWVLDDDHRARRREAAIWSSTGHAAAVFGDELYDILPQTRGGYGRLQDFGIRFGYERVVLHLEPQVEAGRLQCNTARTLLLLDHEPLPWARWGEEFAAAMPAEILRLQERAASADAVPRQEAIRQRVTAILPLYRLSRYRPTHDRRAASHPAADRRAQPAARHAQPPRPGVTPTGAAADAERPRPPTVSDRHDGLTRAADRGPADEQPARSRRSISPTSRGSPPATDPARQATSKIRPPATTSDRHELTINADFRAITDLISHWQDRYRGVAGARTVIEAQVREWCEQILVEVVLAARSSSWSDEQLHALLSPTSFTAALLPRHLLHATLQKRLGQKLGAPRSDLGRARSDAREVVGGHTGSTQPSCQRRAGSSPKGDLPVSRNLPDMRGVGSPWRPGRLA